MSKSYVFDLETTGLLRQDPKLHCAVTANIETNEVLVFHDNLQFSRDGNLADGMNLLYEAELLVGHNIFTFDIPMLKKHTGFSLSPDQAQIDTCLLSCILYPQFKKNSLENWARVLKLEASKIQNSDWSVLTQNILDRCMSDVEDLNLPLYRHLLSKCQTLHEKFDILDIGKALDLEQKVGLIHANQVMFGVGYDTFKARELLDDLDAEMSALEEIILKRAPKRAVNPYSVHVKKPFLKDGGYSKMVRDWFNRDDNWIPLNTFLGGDLRVQKHEVDTVQGPFSRLEFVPLNLKSDQQVKEFLLKLGWRPTEWNYKENDEGKKERTSPKLTEDSYDSLPDGVGRSVADFNIAKHRRSLLLSFGDETKGSLPMGLANCNPSTGIGNVPADAFTCGTPTARYTHVKPVANLPGVYAPWGYRSREIYTVPETHFRQVGVDLDGIEARELAHLCYDYPGGKEFAELVLFGDFHSHNAKTWSVSRNVAKVILYAMMYGAGDYKLGSEAGGGADLGRHMKQAFMEANPAYAELIKDLEHAYRVNGGWIPSIDGRPLYPRTKKDVLNTCIQGNSAIIFKNWMIDCQQIEDIKLGYANQMIAYHDELQFAYIDVIDSTYNPECFGERVCRQALLTGERLGIKVPIAASYDIGRNYSECH